MDARSADTATMLDAPVFHGRSTDKDDSAHQGERKMAGSTDAPRQQASINHGVTRDRIEQQGTKPGLIDYLRYAQRKSGRSPLSMVREYYRLRRGPGRLTMPEYFQYGVYETSKVSQDEQARFLTNTLHWPITHAVCDMTWQSTTEDKWLCSHILARAGIKVPETLAVIDKTNRVFPGTRKISTPDQLRDFVIAQGTQPFFGKENRGICSFGAFLAEGSDASAIDLKGQGPVAYDTFMTRFIGETTYLLQKLEQNHRFLGRYTPNLATVRVCILVDKTEIKIPFAVLKLPTSKNVADSFWRPGNLACNLDPKTGKIVGARTKSALGTMDYDVHPETGAPLLGETLPAWDQVLDLARRCAPIFLPVHYQSMDIAITQDGPVLIEINTGGGFDLPQLASGKGFLTDDVKAFFRTYGYRKF